MAKQKASPKEKKATASIASIKLFKWTGKNNRGKKVTGQTAAKDADEVKSILIKQGIQPVRVSGSTTLFSKQKIDRQDITLVTRQLATMLNAGVPLVQSLKIIGRSTDKPILTQLMETIAREVESGAIFSDVLRSYPIYFDNLYCDLISTGEQSGALDVIFNRLASYREKSDLLRAKIKKAMYYPIAVLLVAITVTMVLLVSVIPQFDSIFKSFGSSLPWFTQVVIELSRIVQSWWYIVLGLLATAIFAYSQSMQNSQAMQDGRDRFVLKLPIFGDIFSKAAIARFARTLATSFSAGVPLVEALRSTAGATGNAVYRNATTRVREDVSSGLQMYTAMQQADVFPDLAIQMVMIGEEAGSLDDMLNKVADVYEEEVDTSVDGLTSLLEPLIIVVLGTVVGSLVIAMYLPIFSLGSVI